MNLMSIFRAPTFFYRERLADDRCVESDRAWSGEIRITPHIGWINDLSWNVVKRAGQ